MEKLSKTNSKRNIFKTNFAPSYHKYINNDRYFQLLKKQSKTVNKFKIRRSSKPC